MYKLIAMGKIKDEGDELLLGSVWCKLNEEGAESEEAGDKYVVVSYRGKNQEKLAAVKDVADLVGENVPGYDGHEEVALAAATNIRYAKTKAIVDKANEGKVVVYAAWRFDM